MPTLKELCIHLLQENVDKIDGPTGLPYDVMEPILLRASPTTLMNIEEYNQYLMEDTGIVTTKPVFSSIKFLIQQKSRHDRCQIESQVLRTKHIILTTEYISSAFFNVLGEFLVVSRFIKRNLLLKVFYLIRKMTQEY